MDFLSYHWYIYPKKKKARKQRKKSSSINKQYLRCIYNEECLITNDVCNIRKILLKKIFVHFLFLWYNICYVRKKVIHNMWEMRIIIIDIIINWIIIFTYRYIITIHIFHLKMLRNKEKNLFLYIWINVPMNLYNEND